MLQTRCLMSLHLCFCFRPGFSRCCVLASVSDQVSHVTGSLFLFQTRCLMLWRLSVSDQCLMSLCPCFCFRPGVSHHYVCVFVSDQARPDQVSLFLTESLVLKGMAHPNIYPLLGACSDEEGPPMVMYPYTHEGNMKKFLQKCRMSECGSRYVSFSLMGWREGVCIKKQCWVLFSSSWFHGGKKGKTVNDSWWEIINKIWSTRKVRPPKEDGRYECKKQQHSQRFLRDISLLALF